MICQKFLVSEEQLQETIKKLGATLAEDYRGKDSVSQFVFLRVLFSLWQI